jgi:proton glutamate symport protein
MKRVGKLALRSLIYFEIVTSIALVVGLAAVNLVRPGDGVALTGSAQAAEQFTASKPTLASVLQHTVPQSFFEAAANNEVLQVVFFSMLFAVGLSQVKTRSKETMLGFCEALSDVMFKFTGLVMKFAPIGIGAAVAVAIGHSGLGLLKNLAALVLTLYGALVVFLLVALLPVALIARVPIRRFWFWVKEPWLIAFSTASSEAALPLAMENVEKLGVPKRIVAFVLPTGYSFNLDGSTLYLAVASVFVAQAAGVHMTLGNQLLMMLTLMLTSKGVAAVPRASLVILSGTLASFGLPLEGVAVILGVDALMDMARTSVNLLGNCLASVVMARWEGEFRDAPHPEELAQGQAVA